MVNADVPRFASTDEAIAYGLHLRRTIVARDEFQTLVRTWVTTQRAVASAPDDNLQAKINLITRCQLLREAVETFLFPESAALPTQFSYGRGGEAGAGQPAPHSTAALARADEADMPAARELSISSPS